ncbi:hypothetical protein ACTXT7_003834 [Hymenolepis weldensis]
MSYLTFILLIAVATFRLDKDDEEVENPDQWKVRAHQIWSYDFRSSQQVMTKIQMLLLFWIMVDPSSDVGEQPHWLNLANSGGDGCMFLIRLTLGCSPI